MIVDEKTILWKTARLAEALSLSVRQCQRLRTEGKIGPEQIRIGGSIRYKAQEVRDWINAAPACVDRRTWIDMRKESK